MEAVPKGKNQLGGASGPALRGFVSVGGARLHYEIRGQGTPLLLLHGNGEDLSIFRPMASALAERWQVVALDTRGHGKSTRGDEPFDFNTFARDVLAVLDALSIQRAVFIGYSDGGNIGLHVALAAPDRVAGLVLLGANLNPRGVQLRYQLPIAAGYGLCAAIALLHRQARPKKEQLELMVRHPRLTTRDIRDIQAPALVLAGEKDMIRREHTESIAKAMPRAQLEILPGETHFTLPASGQVLDCVERFLDKLTIEAP